MQLIVDANILIAAFLKSATTRELLFDEELELFAPEYFTMEVRRTIKENKSLRRCIMLSKEEIEELLVFLLEPIKIIPEEEYTSFIEKATREIPKNDSAFKKQFLTKVYTTSELVNVLKP